MSEIDPSKCYCVIPDRAGALMLVRVMDGRIACPHVWLPPQRLKFFPDHISHIRREVKAAMGIEVTVLRHLRDAGEVQFCLLEVQDLGEDLPSDYRWLDAPSEGCAEWSDEDSHRAWLLLRESAAKQSSIAPWERAGWFELASRWFENWIVESGRSLVGAVEQFKGAWGLSSILTAETSEGTLFLKADFSRRPNEGEVILKLASRWPRNVPRLLALDPGWGWMVTADFGEVRLENLPFSRWPEAVAKYVQIQRSSVDDIQDWSALGCPDMTPDALLRQTREMFAEVDLLCGGASGLSSEEFVQLMQCLPQISEMLESLAASTLPTVICNEDFRAGNVAMVDGQYVFFDWSATVVSHPLFSLNYFLNRMVRNDATPSFQWRTGLDDPVRIAIRDAALAQWAEFAPWDTLMAEFWLCRGLSYMYEALKYFGDLSCLDADSPWGAGTRESIPAALRNLIRAFR